VHTKASSAVTISTAYKGVNYVNPKQTPTPTLDATLEF